MSWDTSGKLHKPYAVKAHPKNVKAVILVDH